MGIPSIKYVTGNKLALDTCRNIERPVIFSAPHSCYIIKSQETEKWPGKRNIHVLRRPLISHTLMHRFDSRIKLWETSSHLAVQSNRMDHVTNVALTKSKKSSFNRVTPLLQYFPQTLRSGVIRNHTL